MSIVRQRVEALRRLLSTHGLDGYIIPTGDPHNSEYVAECWQERKWISGFTGSAGTVVITADEAGLWADSRYYIQARQELSNTGIDLKKMQQQGRDEYITYLTAHLPRGSVIGCNGQYFSVSQIKRFRKSLENNGLKLKTDLDLISDIWQDRPQIPDRMIFEHKAPYADVSRADKIRQVMEKVEQSGANAHLVSTLDDIGWILNIRGYDVAFNPVAIAYLLLTERGHTLFINPAKVGEDLAARLADDNVHILDYGDITDFVQQFSEDVALYINQDTLNYEIYKQIPISTVNGPLPSQQMKAVKTPNEMEFLREVMVKDGVALTRMYRWLEKQHADGGCTEYDVVQKLAEFRSQQSEYYGESFGAIVGFKGNGAIVHYSPDPETSANITGDGVLLIDSGGQYYDGTTDITRTTVFGAPTDEQCKNYTRVLKGHIALARARFPKGTRGVQLDILARHALWQAGLNYGHGTGHGVGFFMNVHEPPQGFVPGLGARGTTVYEVGMYTSNEPGFYKENEYGIRIENLVLTVEDQSTAYGDFLKFETITLFPVCTDLIDRELLNDSETEWLDNYHKRVFEKLSPHLNEDEKKWLHAKCAPVAGLSGQ